MDTNTPSIETQLECQICLSLICEPVTISCGHSFCRTCLVLSLRRSKKQCVTCRSICNIVPEEASENIMLKNIALTVNPTLYNARQKEIDVEKQNWSKVLPVFFYNTVMFPGEVLSLHLFEPRYKLMMQRVANSSRKFAYLYVSPHRPIIGSIVLIAHVREVEFFSDGRCLLEAVLTFPRQRVDDLFEESGTQGLHLARLSPYHDIPMDFSSPLPSSPVEPPVLYHSSQPPTTPSPITDPASTETLSSTNSPNHILSRLANCIGILSEIGGRHSGDPLPPMPSPDMPAESLLLAIEHLSLSILSRCPASCLGEKAQFLRSQNTLERINYCYGNLTRGRDAQRGQVNLSGLISRSVDGVLSWMGAGVLADAARTETARTQNEEDNDDYDDEADENSDELSA